MRCKFLLTAALLCQLAAPGDLHAQGAQASRYYEDALKRFNGRDLDGAAVQLRNALQQDRSFLPAQLLLGRVSLENGNAAAAEVAFAEALRLGASRNEVTSLLAQAMVDQGRHAEMLSDPRLQPGGLSTAAQVRLLVVRAGAQMALGDSAMAMASVEQARSLEPNNIEVWLAETPIRLRAGRIELALAAVDRALQINPRSANAHYLRSSVLHVRGNLDGAMSGYGKAIELDTDHLDARIARAGLAVDLEQLGLAAADIEHLRKRHPKDPRADYLSALIAERRGDLKGSQAAMRRVTELLAPVPIESLRYNTQLLLLGGLSHHAVGELEKAKPYLETVLRHEPRNPAVKLLARILYQQKQIENGIRLLEDYLRGVPQDIQATALLAAGHSAMGRQAKATQLISRALEARDDPQMRSLLGQSLLRAGRFEAAQAELEQAWRRSPNSTATGLPLATVYLRTGQVAKATSIAKALAAAHPKIAGVQQLLGTALAAQGDRRGARMAFEKALQIDRHLMEPKISLARLDQLEGRSQQAMQRLQALHDADTSAVQPMMEMASLQLTLRRPAEAQRWLERASAVAGSRETRPFFALIDLHLQQQQPAKAVEAARVLYSRLSDSPLAEVAYARAALAAGDRNTARGLLLSAGRRVGFEVEPLVEVGSLQHAAGDLAGARHTLNKVLDVDAEHAHGLLLAATVEMESGALDQAGALAARLERLRPRDATTHLMHAEIAIARKQPEAALRSLRRAHELQPSSITAQRLMLHLRQHGDAAAAIQLGEAWLRKQAGDHAVRHALGDLLMASQRWTAARSQFDELLKRRPSDPRALNNQALVLARLNELDRGLELAERAVKAAPGNAVAIDTKAWLLHLKGRHEQALGLLRDARLREPDHAEIRYHLAAVLAKLGRRDEARQELRAALERPSGLESLQEARALAATLN